MTTTCPNCNSPVAPGERFCGECGTDVSAVSKQNSSDAGQTTPITAETLAASQQPSYNQQSGYNAPQLNTQQGVYNQGYQYNTAPKQSNPALMWVGIALLAAGLIFGFIIYALVAGSTSSADLSGQSSAYQAGYGIGQCLCVGGVFLMHGVTGAILLFLGRRK